MAAPPPYTRGFDFTNLTPANIPEAGVRNNAEFDQVSASVAGVRSSLAQIQRDDGAPKNGIIELETLTSRLRALIGGWTPRGTWATATAYAPKDMVNGPNGRTYVTGVAHTSGVFATDLAANRWNDLLGEAVDLNSATSILPAGASSALSLATLFGRSVADVTAYGSGVGAGNATIDTAAYQAAAATGKTVYFPRGTYNLNAGATFTTHGQGIRGDGRHATIINLRGTFTFAAFAGGMYSPKVEGIHFEGFVGSQVRTGGYLFTFNNCVRVRVQDVTASNLTGFFSATRVFELICDRVTYEFHRGAAASIQLYGADSTNRVDNVYFINCLVGADAVTRTAIGLYINGFVNSVETDGLYLIGGFKTGMVVEDTYGWSGGGMTSTPSIMRFNRFGVEYPSDYGVIISAGLDITFDQIYLLGAGTSYGAGGSGFLIGASVFFYQVQIGDLGKIVGFSRYGVESTNNQRVGNLFFAVNTLGSFNAVTTGESLTHRVIFTDNAGQGTTFLMYADHATGDRTIGLDANDSLSYDISANILSVGIAGIPAMQVAATSTAFYQNVYVPNDMTAAGSVTTPLVEIDANYLLKKVGGEPSIVFDPNDYIQFARGSNLLAVNIAGATQDTIGPNTRGFFGVTPTLKPNVTGSVAGNAALASLCSALQALGLIDNNTVP